MRKLLAVFAVSSIGLFADTFDFTTLGGTFTGLGSSFSLTSTNGVTGTFSQNVNGLQRIDQSNGWTGNFLPGTPLVWTAGTNGPVTLLFSRTVSNFSIGIQADFYGDYTGQLEVYNSSNMLLGTVSVNGVSGPAADGSQAVLSFSGSGIRSVRFGVPVAAGGIQDFAFSAPTLNAATGVPEPSSAFILMAGLAASATWIRRRRHQ